MNRVDELANMNVEQITSILIDGQKKILAADLAKGFSVSYRDATGHLVREYPDGRIEPVIEHAKQGTVHAHADNGLRP